MSNFKKILMGAAFAASVSVATTASASVIVSAPVNGPYTTAFAGQTKVLDFENLTDATYLSGDFQVVSGSMSGEFGAPLGDPGHYVVVPKQGSPAPPAKSGYIDVASFVGGPISSFSFYWGSNDTYNTLKLYNTSNVLIKTVVGTGNGSQAQPLTNQTWNFTLTGADQNLGKIELYSNGKAFEADHFAFQSAVPEPATWAMMIIGFGGVGSMLRSTRRKQAAAFA